ncbi:MAG TPA: phosphoribosylformylglycinamidine cyclo-ligase [Dehalococcoidia bacterium]|nr:phosphoribosylformylglycinamidine cyclo-ligase [Dehalococcoidia bacterium]
MPDDPFDRLRTGSYAAAGVDIAAADRLVAKFAELARTASRPEVLAGVGPFSGLFRLQGYADPVLVSSADGVGTKLKLAALVDGYEGLGHDLVNHCVNDILTAGAAPLFFLDYIGGCDLSEEAKVALVRGMAEACREVGCALLGGETADMPGLYASGDFDLVGFIVGAVERDGVIDGSDIQAGDILLGLPSNGLHTNGYSLARKVFDVGLGTDSRAERERLLRHYDELGETLAEALLRPHRCYWKDLQPLVGAHGRAPLLKGIAHITGGGIPGNLPRILPARLGARVQRDAWETPPIFRLIQQRGDVPEEEMWRVFNLGLGMILAVAPQDAEAVRAQLPEALVVGEVVRGTGVLLE